MRKEEKTELTKRKIIAKGIAEFGKNGYAGTVLNSICNQGISKGLFYHNFSGKDSLYLICVNECFEKLINFLSEYNIGSSPQLYMDARLQFFKKYPDYGRIFFEALLDPPSQLRGEISEIKKGFDCLNLKVYTTILANIKLREGITKEIAMNYFSVIQTMFNGYFSSPIYRDVSPTDWMMLHEDYLSKMIDFMLYGIAERG